MGLQIGYEEFPKFEVICELPLSVDYEPLFEGDSVEDHSVSCDKPWSMNLPEYFDFEQRPAQLAVDFGDAESLFAFDSASRTIESVPA